MRTKIDQKKTLSKIYNKSYYFTKFKTMRSFGDADKNGKL